VARKGEKEILGA